MLIETVSGSYINTKYFVHVNKPNTENQVRVGTTICDVVIDVSPYGGFEAFIAFLNENENS